MSGSDNSLWMQAPELANARRRAAFGQALLQQGSDSSPIRHPFQGLARLAAALVGGAQVGQSDRDVAEYNQRQRDELAAFQTGMAFPGASAQPAPQPAATPSPVQRQPLPPAEMEPLIRKSADEAGIPYQLAAGLFQTESGFRPDARNPQSGAGGIGQILASTAANPGYGMEPLADADRFNPQVAIPWATRYLAARGKSAGVTDWNDPAQAAIGLRAYGENTPEYATKVMSAAGMPTGGGPAPMQAAGIDPTAASVHYMNLAQRAAQSPNPLIQRMAPVLMHQAQMMERFALARQPQPKNPILVGDPNDPNKSTYMLPEQAVGLPGPPRAPAVSITGERYSDKKIIDAWDAQGQEVEAGKRRESLFQNIETAMQAFNPGATADLRLKGAQALQALGFETNAPAGELLKSAATQLELANTPKGQGSITENERVLIRNLIPIMGSTPEGVRMLMDMTRRLDQRDQDVYSIYLDSARKNGGVPNPLDVREAIAKLPPALPASLTDRLAPWKAAPAPTGDGKPEPPPGFKR